MRGTTPTHIVGLPISTDQLKTVRFIYAQRGRVVLVKTGDDIVRDGTKVQTTLTQEETFLFTCSSPVEFQVRALTLLNEALKTEVFTIPVGRCLEDVVME